jgi:hypothetical protein
MVHMILLRCFVTGLMYFISTVLACDNAAGQKNYNCFVTPHNAAVGSTN